MSASVKVTTGLKIVPVGDGNLYFAAHKWTKPEITFSLTLELEDGSVLATERGHYRSNNTRLFRLGITDGTRILNLDWAGKYDTVGDYTNSDGNTTVTLDGHALASSTDSIAFTAALTNGVAAYGSGGH